MTDVFVRREFETDEDVRRTKKTKQTALHRPLEG